jgi:hypothetical protein
LRLGIPQTSSWVEAMQQDDQYRAEEAQRRLEKVLKGAFSGPPTPLKDIPTRHGESRKLERKRPQRRRRRQRKNRAA